MPYIYNATSDATGNADFNLQSYTELGIPPSATITVVQPLARVSTAVSSAQNTNVAVRVVSNPTVAEFSYPIVSTEALNETTGISGWKSIRGTVAYDPVVTRGTRPIIRVGKRTATTRVAMVDLVGAYVEYNDEVPPVIFVTVNQVLHASEALSFLYHIKRTFPVNQVIETETALSVTPGVIQTHNKILGQVTETDTAQASPSNNKDIPVNQATEEDNAPGLARTVTKTFMGSA